jgi:hypothetical protein
VLEADRVLQRRSQVVVGYERLGGDPEHRLILS